MSIQHKELAQGRWSKMPFVEQMANIGSEIERSLNWQLKNNPSYSRQAFERSLELLDLTLNDERNLLKLKELTRLRESIVDYFFGDNTYNSTDISWRKYFAAFTYAARRNH